MLKGSLISGSIAAALLFAGQTLAQPRDSDAELEALIPDAAIDDPASWIGEIEAAVSLPQEDAEAADLPAGNEEGFTISWPGQENFAEEVPSLEPEPEAEILADDGPSRPRRRQSDETNREERVSSRITLILPADAEAFPERSEFRARFEALSAIEQLSGQGEDGVAQFAARARSDRKLLDKLLRTYGYFDASVVQEVASTEALENGAVEKPSVRFRIRPGAQYLFGSIDLGDLQTAGSDSEMLRGAFEIQSGDPLYQDRIVSERNDLLNALSENGYPFAQVGDPDLIVDHEREEGDLNMPVSPGDKYVFGDIDSNLPRFLSSRHLQRISRFDPGDTYKQSKVEDLRHAILSTGLVSSVDVTPRETRSPDEEAPGQVSLDVSLEKAPLRTIAGEVGYDTGEGIRAEVSWERRNLFPPEGNLRLRGVAGTKEQLAGLTFQRNNFRERDQTFSADLYASVSHAGVVRSRTLAMLTKLERRSTFLFQRPFQWGVGLSAQVSSERFKQTSDLSGVSRNTYYIAAVPMDVLYDASDDWLNPSAGYRVGLSLSPEYSKVQGGATTTYIKAQVDASYYQPINDRLGIAARTRFGSIQGASTEVIAPSRRLFAGGAGSVRGYGYQKIGPADSNGNPSGGRSLTEFSLEARAKTGLLDDALDVAAFVDAGTVDASSTPTFSDMRYGAGIGLRYQTDFGPIRVDVATPLNRRSGDHWIAIYIALGQAF